MTDNDAPDGGLPTDDLIYCTGTIVSSYVAGNRVGQGELPDLIRSVSSTLTNLVRGEVPTLGTARQKPAVPISRSVMPDYIVCLEDGTRLKMLKRYLRCRFNLSPDEYRRKWKLSPDYPMVAPNYAKRRSDFAKAVGLGKTVRRM